MKKTTKNNSKMTLEKLAVMIQEGFEETARKDDLEIVKADLEIVKAELVVVKEDMSLMNGRLHVIESELIDIKKKLDNIIYRHEYEALKDRVAILEQKLKFSK